MNTLSYLVSMFGWSIIHTLWQITLIALLVWVLLGLFRNASAVVKYNIVLAGIFAAFAAFTLTIFVYAGEGSGGFAEYPTGIQSGTALASQLPNGHSNVQPLAVASAHTMQELILRLRGTLDYVVITWMLGFLFFAFRFAGSFAYVYRLKHFHSARLHDQWQSATNKIRNNLGIKRAVALLESGKTSIPIVIGHLKPAIILPIGLVTQIPFNQLEAILVHEMAHIRRNDYLVNLFVTFAEWFFFYHPLFWWLSRSLDRYREHSCDDITIQYCGNPDPLQKALLDLSGINQKSIPVAAALFTNNNQLLKRIKRMKTNNQKNHEKRFNPAALLLMPAVMILLLAVSSFVPRQGYMLNGPDDDEGYAIGVIKPVETANINMHAENEPAALLPDTTKETKDRKTTIEFDDNGSIHIELDAEGNLVKVTKDGKELTGKEREKYEKLTAKLKQLKEEEENAEKNKEELERLEQRLKETEKKMKHMQQEYQEAMNEYMRAHSQLGWSAYDSAWGLYDDRYLKAEELQKMIERETAMAGIYNRYFFEHQDKWVDQWDDLYNDRFADREEWIHLEDLFENEYLMQQEHIEKALKEKDLEHALQEELLLQKLDQLEELQGIKQIEMEALLFEEVVREELVKDGLLKHPGDNLSFTLTNKRLVVNGEKQNADLHKKYTKLYDRHSDTPLSGDMRVIIED